MAGRIASWAKTSALEIFTLGRGVRRSLDGYTFRVSPKMRWLMGSDKEPELRAFMRERVRPGDVLLDVGAHAGFYVLFFSKLAPQGSVIAFEPNPDTRRFLMRNVRLNSLDRRVTIEPFAVSDRAAESNFFGLPGEGRSRLQSAAFHADLTTVFRVSTVTLDNYIAQKKITPNWLLIDIEGFEIAALRGAERLIQSSSGTLNIVVEMHPNVWEQSGSSRAELETLLEKLKLRAVPLGSQSDPLGENGIVHLEYCS